MDKRASYRQRLAKMTKNACQDGVEVVGGKVDFDQDPNWWRSVVWKYGTRCNGWTLWQIYKNDMKYLDWIKEFFTFKYNQGYLLSAVNAAVEFKTMREQEERC